MILAITAIFANAQFKAGIQGTVTDNAGSIVSGATVTLTNKETNQTQQTQSSDGGFYRFSGLAPGQYTVTVEKENFKKQVVEEVTVNAEALEGVNVSLQAGGVSETVTVTAETAPLETEDANIRKTISTEEVLSLPQNGRNPYELARLTPGVFGTGARSADGGGTLLPNTSGPGGSSNSIFATEDRQPISANGQRVSSNNYQIDGSSVNSQTFGGAAVITPSQESVKEVQITSSTYSAEDGRNSGAQIKVVSQNGTNDWHGSAFFKLNDPKLNAFNKFPYDLFGRNTTKPLRVEQKYKSYGGSFGGRIIKDRLFFFFAYEGLTNKTNNINPTPVYVETASYRAAVLAARPGSVAAALFGAGSAPRIASVVTPSCSELPDDINGDGQMGRGLGCVVVGNGLDLGSITGARGQYVQFFNANRAPVGGGLDGIADLQKVLVYNPANFKGNQYNTRIDFNATDKDRLTVSTYIVPNTSTVSDYSSQSREIADITSKRLSYALGFIYARTISATKYNELRFNVTRWGFDETKTNPNANFALPRVEIESISNTDRIRYGAAWGQNTPGQINEKQFEIRDTFTNVIGNHALKFGAEYRRDINNNSEVGFARPLFTFKGLWNFANDTPIFEQVVSDPTGKPVNNNTRFHTGDLGFFVQDDWKFRPNLTLNMGLRWEYFAPITSDKGLIGNLVLGPNGTLNGAKIITQKNISDPNYKNFAPQLGFAYSPNWLGENKLVIRGGGGIGYDRLPNALLSNARRNPPNGSIYSFCCGTNGTSDGFGTPFADGHILYAQSSDGTITGYPANPTVGGGLNPTTGFPNFAGNGLDGIEIYGTPRDLPDAVAYRYSLEGQYELPKNLVATIGYQGSQGRHFVRINPLLATTSGSISSVRAAFFASPDVNSNYNAMIVRLQGRLFKQFSFDSNYRFAKSIDTASYESPCACTNQSFPVDQRQERGPSDFDVRHAFVASATWEVPFFNKGESLAGKLLGGFQISTIITYNTGFPWTPKIFGCLQQTGTPQGFCDLRPTSYTGLQPDANTNANFLRPLGIFGAAGTSIFGSTVNTANPFANPPAIGRNVFRGPRYFDTDLTVSKKFGLGGVAGLNETAAIDVRFNFFNVFNTLNLAPFNSNSEPTRIQPNTTLDRFGRATAALAGRVGEFQIRFSF
jgi:Carboxypeptidase regulatory-like domain/TonB dependent receptor